MSTAQDEMAEAHRRDYAAEGAFRQTVRDIDALCADHGHRLAESDKAVLREAQERLGRKADLIVAVWE